MSIEQKTDGLHDGFMMPSNVFVVDDSFESLRLINVVLEKEKQEAEFGRLLGQQKRDVEKLIEEYRKPRKPNTFSKNFKQSLNDKNRKQ